MEKAPEKPEVHPPPPPQKHVLRPHEMLLLVVILCTFKEFEGKGLPPAFVLHLYRFLTREVSEVTQPKSADELFAALRDGPEADHPVAQALLLKVIDQNVGTGAEVCESTPGSTPLIPTCTLQTRRSLLGYFCRRCFISYIKLSYHGLCKLQHAISQWKKGQWSPDIDPPAGDDLIDDRFLFRTPIDASHFATPDAFASYEKALLVGDDKTAADSLRRYFDQRFHTQPESKNRQHAMLNLIRLHYVRSEYTAARKLLQEAIAVSRISGDRVTLQHCTSMLNRLPPVERGRKPALNEIQPDLHPLELLFDVKKLMQTTSDQPLGSSFEKITESIGLFNHWIDVQGNEPAEDDEFAQHAVQSIVWSAAGRDKLAHIEEDIVTTFMSASSETTLSCLANRAYAVARQGSYDEGLAMLLEPSVWQNLATMPDYNLWANEVWHILVLRATRRGQIRTIRDFLRTRRTSMYFLTKEYSLDGDKGRVASAIRDPLYKVMELKRVDQGAQAVEPLLVALWKSEFQGRFGLYRTAIVMLADISLEFGWTKKARRIIEEIMPQVIAGDDIEQRALACFVYARCIIAAADDVPTGLRQALAYLHHAEEDYRRLELYVSLADVQYFLSVVYHNLDMVQERDAAAKRHEDTVEEQRKLDEIVVDDDVLAVCELIADIGAALAAR
ncbi:hypothetical protein PUNSTDRAFT_105115 [Punctularia strigosozonata HHB-11173 SS5]|uniref:uncharacterized protein n=1 Tax=Punctularia strigosozonata (strain HHB-11173) TaxID=741275 RepID=UPI00044165EC|nr:uncharacterized protein PUNSTDRAFT_105115 [Punctularia strigosozonata HHB-11173 SS5]EIN07406.1 hypothetical protein PUNSTDRAFT_105115 [Punctularia strigosozonata HHB-11173 SS5]